jgi:hypothetical protein
LAARFSTILLCLLLASATRASALDVTIKTVRSSSSVVTATVDVRSPVPDRFKKVLEDGGVLHLRVQAELWEVRPVWDRLVFPAIARAFRLARAVSGREIAVTDPAGRVTTEADVPATVPVTFELGASDRIQASAKYYVHVLATVGTIAEREMDDVGDAVFGRESEANTLGSLGRAVFRTVIKVSDYLQSVSAESTSKRTSGADLLRP